MKVDFIKTEFRKCRCSEIAGLLRFFWLQDGTVFTNMKQEVL